MCRQQKNVLNTPNDSIKTTANHLFQTDLQALPLVEDVRQEAQMLAMAIACMHLNLDNTNQRT